MKKFEVLQKLQESGIVAVLRNMTPSKVIGIVDGLKSAGVTAIEITVENHEGLKSIRAVKEHFGTEVLLGAGTVLDGETAMEVIRLGVDFIVTPIVSFEAIKVANRYGCFIGVGALTPTEIFRAYEAGADLVKVFPADSMGGAAYLKNLQGPLGHIPIMPTGGITLGNIDQYKDSGAIGVGIGSALYKYDTVEEIYEVAAKFRSGLLGMNLLSR